MDLFWIIYLIDILSISKGLAAMAAMLAFSILLGIALKMIADPDSVYDQGMIRISKLLTNKYSIIVAISFSLLATIIPSKDTAYKMLAAYGVTEAYAAAQSSDKVKAIAGKSLEVLEKAMDDYLTKEDK